MMTDSIAFARVRSFLPRRLRVEVPAVSGNPRLAAGAAVALRTLADVEEASVSAVTGRALLVFVAPVEDLERVLADIVRAVAQAVPVDQQVTGASLQSMNGGSDVSDAQGDAQGDAPLQREWVRVLGGAVAVGTLAAVRLLGGPLALVSPPVALLVCA